MKLTIVKPDNVVGINEEFYSVDIKTNPLLDGIRVIQWDKTSGHIEYENITNELLDDENVKKFDPIIELWNNAKSVVIKQKNKDDTTELDKVLSVYPIVNIKDATSIIEAFTNESMILKLMTRGAHSNTCDPKIANDIIGVVCEQLRYTNKSVGAVTLLNMRSFRGMSLELGVPIFSTIQDPDTAEQIAKYNVDVMGQSRIDIGDVPFLYSPWDLTIYKNRKNRIIESDRDASLSNGFTWNGYKFDSDNTSRNNLTAVIASLQAGIALPDNFAWRTKDNQNIALDASQLAQLGSSMLDFVNTTYVNSWNRKTIVDNASTFEQVDNA